MMTNGMSSRFNDGCDVLHILRQTRLHFNRTNNHPQSEGGRLGAKRPTFPVVL